MPARMQFVGLAAAAVTLSLGVSMMPTSAWAEEAPTTAAQALEVVEKLRAEQAELDRQYNEINAVVTGLGDRADSQRAQIDTADAKVDTLKAQLGSVALASFQGRGADGTLGLLTSTDSASFLNRVGTMDQVATNQSESLRAFQTEQANLADLQRSLAASEAAAHSELVRMKDIDDAARAKVVQAQAVADRLTAEEKAKLEAETARRDAEAQAAREAEAAAQAAPRASGTAQERMAAPVAARPEAPAMALPARQTTAPRPVATTAAPATETTSTRATAVAAPRISAPVTTAAAAPTTTATKAPAQPAIASGHNRYSWGQCTWWAFERRAAMGRPVGGAWGNANVWPGAAAGAGFSVNRTPAVGAVLIEYFAPVGHASVVESISGGSITVSEMNWNGGVGVLHYRTIKLPAGGVFIH